MSPSAWQGRSVSSGFFDIPIRAYHFMKEGRLWTGKSTGPPANASASRPASSRSAFAKKSANVTLSVNTDCNQVKS